MWHHMIKSKATKGEVKVTTSKVPYTLRMQDENLKKLRIVATLEKRSMANLIELLVEKFLADYESQHGPIPAPPK